MKNATLTFFLLFSLNLFSQTTNILVNVYGTPYKATGANGLTLNSDGSITFHGGYILAPLTEEEIEARDDYYPELPPPGNYAKEGCGATSTWTTGGTQGGTINVALFNNKCGPVIHSTDHDGTTHRVCFNANSYLCSATVGYPSNSDFYLNDDCN